MKALSKIKVSYVLIIISVLVVLFLFLRLGDEKSSVHKEIVLYDQEITNDFNTASEKEFRAGVAESAEKTPFQTFSSIEQKEPSLAGAKLPEFEPPLPSPFDDDELEFKILLAQRDQIRGAQDKVMKTWPDYLDMREQLHRELLVELDLENLSNEQLIESALKLRDQFWKTGGCSSMILSYRHAYMARILLELAHNREPENMTITDELVETIQTTWVRENFDPNSNKYVRNNEAVEDLLELRSGQYAQIKREIEQGRTPTWEDFVRINDQAWLLHRSSDFESAQEAVEWLIEKGAEGGWADYMQPLRTWQNRLKEGKKAYNYNIYTDTSEPEEKFRYGRRLPSFRGPNPQERGVTPVHIASSSPIWSSK